MARMGPRADKKVAVCGLHALADVYGYQHDVWNPLLLVDGGGNEGQRIYCGAL